MNQGGFVQEDPMENIIVLAHLDIMVTIAKLVDLFIDLKKNKKILIINTINKLAVNCSDISNEDNSEWNQTLAIGEKVNGKCLDGFQGSVTRRCIQSDANGNWGPISGSCNGNFFYFFFLSFFLSFFVLLTKSHKTNKIK